MDDRQRNENYNNTYSIRAAKYSQTKVLPLKVITTYSNPKVYTVKTGDYFDNSQISNNTTYTTKTETINNTPYTTQTKTTYTTETETNNNIMYDYSEYFKDYDNAMNNNINNINNIINYETNTYTYDQSNKNNQATKNYGYNTVKVEKPPSIQKCEPEIQDDFNNIIYDERLTNYHQSNPLNLNDIYNNDINDKYIKNNINYEYDNNNMYLVQSGYNVEKTISNPIEQNNYYYDNTQIINNQQNTNKNKNISNVNYKVNKNMNYNVTKINNNVTKNPKNKKINNTVNINPNNVKVINNNNNNNKTNNNVTNINNKNNKYNQTIKNIKIITNNQIHSDNANTNKNKKNTTTNNKKISNNNNSKNNKMPFKYSGYNNIQKISVNDIDNSIDEEPPDNMRNRTKNNHERFNHTMPNLNPNEENKISMSEDPKNKTMERKSQPVQAISIEITKNNNTHSKSNNIPVKTNNIIFVNSNTNNNTKNIKAQNVMTENNNNIDDNMEYSDKYGNVFVLINGKLVRKNSLTNTTNINNTTNDNKTTNDNNTTKINNNTNIDNKTNINKNNDIDTKINQNYKNKDNVYYEEEESNNEEPTNTNNGGAFFDTYTGQVINNQNKEKKTNSNINKIKQEFDLKNDEYFNNTYPTQKQIRYKNDNLYDNNTNVMENQNQNSNLCVQPPFYDTSLNMNIDMNTNYNMDMDMDQGQQQEEEEEKKNILFKKTKSSQIYDNDVQIIEPPQRPKKRRPVYKIPPSKKRAVSQGKSLIFIHKYYDENFILEEDNEDNVSDNENKKTQNKPIKNIFREVTNIKRLIPKWQELGNQNKEKNDDDNNSIENPENTNIIKNEEEQNNLNENEKNNNIENNVENNLSNSDINIEPNYQNMRLSYMRLSLEKTSTIPDENVDNNNNDNVNIESSKEDIKKIENENNIKNENDKNEKKDDQKLDSKQNPNIESSLILTNSCIENNDKQNYENSESKDNIIYKSEILDNNLANSQIENISNIELSQSKICADSNLSGPKNSDSIIKKKDSDNININIENKNSKDSLKDSQKIENNSIMNGQSNIKENNSSSNMNNNSDINMNLNIDLESKENDDEKRITLNIADYDLDKYFEKEGINKRDPSQQEVSTSLKTIDLNEEKRNSQIIVDSLQDEEQKENLKIINSTSSEDSTNGSKLITNDDGLVGGVHLPEKNQNDENKNN